MQAGSLEVNIKTMLCELNHLVDAKTSYILSFLNAGVDVDQDKGYHAIVLWPLLLTWFNFNPSMDK